MKVEFGITRFENTGPSAYHKVLYLWKEVLTDEQKKEGLKKAGYLNDNIANVNFYMQKAALNKLGYKI